MSKVIDLTGLSRAITKIKEWVNGVLDWSAQEGEDGYIKNKPSIGFEKVFGYYSSPRKITSDELEDYVTQDPDLYYTPNYVFYPDFTLGNVIKILGLASDESEDYTLIYSDKEYTNLGNFYNGYSLDLKYYPQTQTIYIYYDSEDGIEFNCEYYKNHGTPIKTTPQTLTGDEKNQALTNLGIDPVVWKYLCNPHKLINGGVIPNELLTTSNTLKYINNNMYLVVINSTTFINTSFNFNGDVILYLPVASISSDGRSLQTGTTLYNGENNVKVTVNVTIMDGRSNITII